MEKTCEIKRGDSIKINISPPVQYMHIQHVYVCLCVWLCMCVGKFVLATVGNMYSSVSLSGLQIERRNAMSIMKEFSLAWSLTANCFIMSSVGFTAGDV